MTKMYFSYKYALQIIMYKTIYSIYKQHAGYCVSNCISRWL